MATEAAAGALAPELAFALVGALGVGAQWLAWRLRIPGIVLLLLAGLVAGPVLGWVVPSRDFGALVEPMVAIAVAIILFEGGLTLDRRALRDAAHGVRRLVLVGAPVGWALSAAALHWVAGLDWSVSAVIGGILIVTGPTVIAPLLRQARLARRPALLLQWEAIVNDPIGALAAVLAWQVVQVSHTALTFSEAAAQLALGIVGAAVMGSLAGRALVEAFRGGRVPEYMKVPVLFAAVLAGFAVADWVLPESGLLTVTLMGVVIANAELPSYTELRRFKEHATVLLVGGVFILLAANIEFAALAMLDWHAAAFVAAVVLVVRPATVLLALAFSDIPWRERVLVALTGPRGVVLVAVAGLFGEKLAGIGIADGAQVVPLAFALVAVTVVLHGFTLAPLARALGLAGSEAPGLLIVGGSQFTTALARAVQRTKVPVLVADPNWVRLRSARAAGLPTYYGDILAEAAEHGVELVSFGELLAASDNDAYNTLVATDLGAEFGRDAVWQISRASGERPRHALPATLGGRQIGSGAGYAELERLIAEGWAIGVTRLSDEFSLEDWRSANPDAVLLGRFSASGGLRLMADDAPLKGAPGLQLISMAPPEPADPAARA